MPQNVMTKRKEKIRNDRYPRRIFRNRLICLIVRGLSRINGIRSLEFHSWIDKGDADVGEQVPQQHQEGGQDQDPHSQTRPCGRTGPDMREGD